MSPALYLYKGGIMNLQTSIIKQYLLLNGDQTLRAISAQTGIQQTRVFRLLNGSEMKLAEYEIFHQQINKHIGLKCSLADLAEQCFQNLNTESIKELEIFMNRKLSIWKMKQEYLKSNQSISIA